MLWAEFDCIAPVPGCNCAQSRDFFNFMKRQKLLQFLMGLNELYEQARSQILMLIQIPSVNQAYSMMIERESQRIMANTAGPAMNLEIAALMTYRHHPNKIKRDWNAQCDHCKLMGHTKVDCYRLIGYPPNFKFKKKFENNTDPPEKGGEYRGHAHNVRYEDNRPHSDGVQTRDAYANFYKDPGPSDFNRNASFSHDWHRSAGAPNYSQTQYNQMMHHTDGSHPHNQFRKVMPKADVPESSSNMCRQSDPTNMGGPLKWEGTGDW
ncbi:hypothetical protein AABB24_015794 [Solanum stoloniferum]|uniref:Uncharacterized protein n=1 Tax=Solanum stoloniferum TaxID=62892 RepID=A0ABD2TRJ8_9SOLN